MKQQSAAHGDIKLSLPPPPLPPQFLVGRDGRVAARLSPNVRPLALKPKIQALLAGGDQAGGQLMST